MSIPTARLLLLAIFLSVFWNLPQARSFSASNIMHFLNPPYWRRVLLVSSSSSSSSRRPLLRTSSWFPSRTDTVIRRRRSFSSIGTQTINASNDDGETTTSVLDDTRNKNVRDAARTKRKERIRKGRRNNKMIGLAKAVDHGDGQHFAKTYAPRPFRALSGLPSSTNSLFTVLGIESSCDDTGAAIVRSDGVILGEALAKQIDIHEVWGGVVPGLARDAHVQAINDVIAEALEKSQMQSIAEVDAIAVTVGPGLEICLRVGCETAVALAQQFQKPFVGIHHLEAHILMARLPTTSTSASTMRSSTHDGNESNNKNSSANGAPPQAAATTRPNFNMEFPFLALLASGGHCQILRCDGIGDYTIMGGTLDDSLGEAYDKTARLLGLPVGGGGGPAIEQFALKGDRQAIPLTVPMQARKDCDFSYAGLKTNVRRAAAKLVEKRNQEAFQKSSAATTATAMESITVESPDQLPDQDKADLAASFQHVAIKHVEQRLTRAMEMLEKDDACSITKLAVVGGVAANQELRSRLQSICDHRAWTMHVPPPRLCTDQGTMSAWAGVERLLVGSSDNISSDVYARYPFAVMPNSGDDDSNTV